MTATAVPSPAVSVDAAVRVFTLLALAEECVREGADMYAFDAVQTANIEQPVTTAVMSCVGASSLKHVH